MCLRGTRTELSSFAESLVLALAVANEDVGFLQRVARSMNLLRHVSRTGPPVPMRNQAIERQLPSNTLQEVLSFLTSHEKIEARSSCQHFLTEYFHHALTAINSDDGCSSNRTNASTPEIPDFPITTSPRKGPFLKEGGARNSSSSNGDDDDDAVTIWVLLREIVLAWVMGVVFQWIAPQASLCVAVSVTMFVTLRRRALQNLMSRLMTPILGTKLAQLEKGRGKKKNAILGEGSQPSPVLPKVMTSSGRVASDWVDPRSPMGRAVTSAPNSFLEPLTSNFMVRGANYLQDKVKVPSESAVFQPIGVHVYMRGESGATRIEHVAESVPSLAAHLAAAAPDSFFFLLTWIHPGPPYRVTVFAFERRLPVGNDPTMDRVWGNFVEGTDAFRQDRFKYIASLKVAPWAVLAGIRTLGGEKPTIIGNKLHTPYFRGRNYLEVDIDISSSTIACSVTGLVIPKISGMEIEHAFLIEGKSGEELPERCLCAIRIQQSDLITATISF